MRVFILIVSIFLTDFAVAETWSIGLVFDLTGKKPESFDVLRGISIAEDELKKSGLNFSLFRYNSGNNAVGTRRAMRQATANNHDFIIAESESSKALVAARIAESKKKVMLTPYATSPVVTKNKNFVFRSCFVDTQQGSQLAKFARNNLKAKTAVVVVDAGQLYSKVLAQHFSDQFKKLGGKIFYEVRGLFSNNNFGKSEIDRILNSSADIVFLPLYDSAAASIINRSKEFPQKKQVFLGGDGLATTAAFRNLVLRKNPNAEVFWVSHFSGVLSEPKLKSLNERFKQKYPKEKFTGAVAIGYDAMMLTAQALKKVGKSPKQQHLVAALRAINSFQGTTGLINFNGKNDPFKSFYIWTYKNGKVYKIKEVK